MQWLPKSCYGGLVSRAVSVCLYRLILTWSLKLVPGYLYVREMRCFGESQVLLKLEWLQDRVSCKIYWCGKIYSKITNWRPTCYIICSTFGRQNYFQTTRDNQLVIFTNYFVFLYLKSYRNKHVVHFYRRRTSMFNQRWSINQFGCAVNLRNPFRAVPTENYSLKLKYTVTPYQQSSKWNVDTNIFRTLGEYLL